MAAPVQRTRFLATIVLAALLAVPLLPAPTASASSHRSNYPVELAYHVHDVDPGTGTVDVTLTIRDPQEHLRSFEFITVSAPYDVGNFSATGGTLDFKGSEVGVKLTLDEPVVTFSYEVKVIKKGVQAAGPRDGTGSAYHSYLADTWGVVKAEAFAMGFNVVHSDRVDPVWDGSLRFSLPDGWSAEGPWVRQGDAYDLPRDDPLPKGFVALGSFTTETREGPWRSYRYVRLGDAPAYETDLLPYLEASTPYLSTVYGNHTGRVILAVSAPDPMFRGGLGGWNSLYLHEDSMFKTLSHEHAHVWQGYRAVKTAGQSSLWIVEGDADYHGPLSLVASEFWSSQDAENHFKRFERVGRDRGNVEAPLVDATYGNEHERVAYVKGALVLHALDGAMREASNGRVGVPDLIRTLNGEMSPANPAYAKMVDKRVNNSYILDTVERLVGTGNASGVRSLVERYLTTSDAPSWTGLDPGAGVSFEDLRLEPPAGLPGHPSTVHVTVRNTAATPAERSVELLVNGTVVATRDLHLDPGRSKVLTFQLPDAEPGSYPVRVAYLTRAYRVLQPADLDLVDVNVVPRTPGAGSTAEVLAQVTNQGEAPGNVTVHVVVDGNDAATRTFPVPGGVTRSLAVPFPVPAAAGNHTVRVLVTSIQVAGETVGEEVLSVRSVGDRDGDGVPDDEDDFPDDPRVTESTPLSEVVHRLPVPGPGPSVLLSVTLGVALLAGRRVTRRRGRR